MVFSSLVFLWIFLPLTLLGYYLAPEKFKNIWLLLTSLIFYAWGEPKYIVLMLFSIAVNWLFGILIEKYSHHKKLLLAADVVINLGLLGYFKYFNFLVDILNRCLHLQIEAAEIPLPIGISFFTFQILSYVIDLYRGHYKAQKNIINLALYISFFPQLIAGPIVQYKDINEQLESRTVTAQKTAEGIRRFIYGFGKKVLIANTTAKCVDYIYGLEYRDVTGSMAWIAAILYTLQIYYDFSGYSDMAIGLGKMFGFEFLENFRYPYLSQSIQEFWRRWHISLGAWFRQYLYIPLGGNRKGKVRTYINLTIVFAVTGLWHGASFNFVLWGLYYGLFLIAERMGGKKLLEKSKILSHIYVLAVVVFGWVLFRAEDLVQAGIMVKRMLMPWKYVTTSVHLTSVLGTKTMFLALMGVLGCGTVQICLEKSRLGRELRNSTIELVYGMFVLVIGIAMLASNTYNPFIYFRF